MAIIIENPADQQYLKQKIDEFVQSAFKQNLLALDGAFGQNLRQLASYGFNPKDLDPDEMNNLVTKVKEFL
ncbi:MAG TPA: hypothetical protein VLI90_00660 [Tepidisphaeraceae bacterium]|nr:hypothetical protein [Tepidisphaeraceae bacterium]